MMPEWLQLVVVFGVFLLLLAAGMQTPFAISVPAILYLVLYGGFDALRGLGLTSWGSTNSFTLTSIPLFILMAELLQASGLSSRIYRGLAKLVSPLPGGLLQTNIAGCALFSAISGSSVATAAAIGTPALPQLTERNYDRRLSAGSLAAGGTLGILIPPSIAMIVYGTFTETSIAKLFMAGIIPGLLLTAMFMAYIALHALRDPKVAPREEAPKTVRDYLEAAVDLVPFVLLIGGTLGSIYLGYVTPTEAAAVGCVLAYVIGRVFGDLPWRTVRKAISATVLICGNILFIVYAAFIFSYAISLGGIGESLTAYVVDLKLSWVQFFLALLVLYTVLGCLVESLGMIVITVPLLYPVLIRYGVDPVWFGVMLVVFIEMGQISPPLGINLFVIQSIWDGKLADVVIGTIPFHLIMFVFVAMLAIWPEIVTWLPQQMTTGPQIQMTHVRRSIAVVGLGAMGLPMALRLVQGGFDVRGVDRAAARRERFREAAGVAASSVSDAVRGADALLLLVVNAEQAEDVLFGPNGAADVMDKRCIVLLSLTTSPASALALGRRLADRGIRMIDAPVSGGVKRAAAGTLTVLASGAPEDMEAVRHFLAALGSVHEIGPDVGQASAVKLINQLLCGVHLVAAAEATALAEYLGVDPRKVHEVVKTSSGTSHMFADRVPLMLGDESRPTAAIDILVKDLALVCDLATSVGARTPTARRALDLFKDAASQGLGGLNDSEVIRCLRSPA